MMIQKENLLFGLAGIVAGIIVGVLMAGRSNYVKTAPATPPQTQQQSTAPVTRQQPQAAADEQQPQAQGQLPAGHPAIDANAMQKQLELHRGILEKDPDNQTALIAAANLSSDLKDYPQAIVYYEKALKKEPDNVNLITDLGTSYFYSNKPQKALSFYDRSLKINPKHFQTLMNVGIVKMSLGDHQGAAESWEKVITLYPDSREAAQLKETVRRLKERGTGPTS